MDIAVAGPSNEHVSAEEPAWLYILLDDGLQEVEDAILMGGLLGETERAIIWTMCDNFRCVKFGVPGQTCRVFERYLAHLFRIGILGNDQIFLINNMAQRLMLTLGCCFQIAMKSTRSTANVRSNAIRIYLASLGCHYTIAEIVEMKREIYRGIGYNVPLFNSIEMAELLAEYLNVEGNVLVLTGLCVQLAELRRNDIEEEVHFIASLHGIPYSTPRVRTVDLAAGCVAAAVKKSCLQASNNVANVLACMLRVSGHYITILRDVILLWVASFQASFPEA